MTETQIEIKKAMLLATETFSDVLNEMKSERVIDEKTAGYMRYKFLEILANKINLLVPKVNRQEN